MDGVRVNGAFAKRYPGLLALDEAGLGELLFWFSASPGKPALCALPLCLSAAMGVAVLAGWALEERLTAPDGRFSWRAGTEGSRSAGTALLFDLPVPFLGLPIPERATELPAVTWTWPDLPSDPLDGTDPSVMGNLVKAVAADFLSGLALQEESDPDDARGKAAVALAFLALSAAGLESGRLALPPCLTARGVSLGALELRIGEGPELELAGEGPSR
jgi:hypothetical protein